jgi:16S rRNA (guanine(966)-N(2))-methyltransferase RsmD
MELRISSGEYKNKKLKVPKSASPVRERVKLAIFSILADKVAGADCIDICAGSGNLGLEALSRGANSCTFVEEDYEAVSFIKENINNLSGMEANPNKFNEMDKAILIKSDMVRHIANDSRNYDIVFWDPPYEAPVKHAFKYIHDLLKKDGIIVYLHSSDAKISISEINQDLRVMDSRKYGVTTVDFISRV